MATAEELYGPQRTLARDTAKRLLEKDHVRCNFQRGIERQSSHQAFLTETAKSFRVCKSQLISAVKLYLPCIHCTLRNTKQLSWCPHCEREQSEILVPRMPLISTWAPTLVPGLLWFALTSPPNQPPGYGIHINFVMGRNEF